MRIYGSRMAAQGLLIAALALGGCGEADGDAPTTDAGNTVGEQTDVAAESGADATDSQGEDATTPLASSCAPGYEDGPFQVGQNTGYEVAGQSRSFYLQLPDAERFPGPRPVIFCFHGTNGSGLIGFEKYQLAGFVEAGFIVIAPDSHKNGEIWPVWDAMHSPGSTPGENPDLALFDSLIDCLGAHHPVDTARRFVVGMSAGGIMVNYVLQRRSEVLAGGVAASGIFDLTSPDPMPELEDMAVMVTWGGSNDAWGGDANGEVVVANVNFVEQASVASQFWEGVTAVNQIHCVGDELGHAWLIGAVPLMVDFFMAHPKGGGGADGWTLPETDEAWQAACSEEAAVFVPALEVVCPETTTPVCQTACQLMVDCVLENATVAPVLGPQMPSMGFEGDPPTCDGCLSQCEQDVSAGGPTELEVVACFDAASQAITCGGGIQGAVPYIGVVNDCCEGQLESPYCTRLCEALMSNDTASAFFPSCEAWAAP